MKKDSVKETGILFSGPMIKAIMNDHKKMTRRIIEAPANIKTIEHEKKELLFWGDCVVIKKKKSKYEIGDLLWVREAWGITAYNEYRREIGVQYKADKEKGRGIKIKNEELFKRLIARERLHIFKNCTYSGPICIANIITGGNGECSDCKHYKGNSPILWRSPLFMPRAAARLILKITDVKIEKLRNITEADAQLEGFTNTTNSKSAMTSCNPFSYCKNFAIYWNNLHFDKPGHCWDQNPWVYAITFERVK
jgi:hypothetical protein